ncbi:hypothetical protein AB4P95_07205 [Pseudomonas sp. A1437]|uniref:hypothetical protein n=1 Tax=Pseudomonas TaxID=286 RepID=UPI00190BCBF5|nr:hypothetical protein [Pseudomonas rhodesiae]MBK3483435.1 hypothetical protein [Pseudomonas fluorescens]MDN6865050.1 hypothetical protein [Pseudomonas rhodesiae]
MSVIALMSEYHSNTCPGLNEGFSEVCSNRFSEALGNGSGYALELKVRMLFAVKIYIDGTGH